jgi:hypothetical protein
MFRRSAHAAHRSPLAQLLGAPRAPLLRAAFVLAALVLAAAGPARAQLFFGKNKVQYTDLTWQVMETPHLALHFYPEERELARWVAVMAEEACVEFMAEMELDSLRAGRIPFLLYSTHRDFEQTNVTPSIVPEEVGGLTDLIKGRVLVPHTGSYHRLRWVVRHELVHALMLEKLAQDMRAHKKTRYSYPPLWYVEGLAEFLAADWDGRADMILRDAVIHDELVSIAELWTIDGTFQMYKEGQSILLHIAAAHGRDKVLEYLKRWWKTDKVDVLTTEILGTTTAELDAAWTAELRRRYYPQVEAREAVDVAARRIVGHGDFNLAACAVPPPAGDPAAPEGDLELVFLSSHGGYAGLRHGRAPAGVPATKAPEPVLLAKGGSSEEFESLHFFESALDVNATREVIFVARSGARDVLHIVDVDRRRRMETLDFPSLVALGSPAWSPDGKSIVMSGVNVAGHRDLYCVARDGSGLTPLTDDLYDDRDPDWSPDGTAIVFASDRCPDGPRGAASLYLLDLASGAVTPLTSGPHEDAEPAFAPDGRRIAFRSDRRDGCYDLYLADLDGRVTPLRRFQTAALDPEWTPDGKSLLFTTFVEGTFAIYATPVVELPAEPLPAEPLPVPAFTAPALTAPALASPPLAQLAGVEAIAGAPESPSWEPAPLADLEPDLHERWVPATADTTYPVSAYKRRFALDLIQGGVAFDPDFGGGGGGQIAFSDLLNNEQILLFIANEGGDGGSFLDSFDVGVTYYNSKRRLNWALGAFRLARTYNADLDLFLQESRLGGVFLASYPLSRFNRVETSLVARRITNHLYRNGVLDDTYFVSNLFSYVHDSTLWSRIGPFDGARYGVTLGLTTDLGAGLGDYVSVLGDYRRYHRIAGDMTYALRGQGRLSFGDEGQRYYAGGAFSLRGYPHRSVAGQRLLLLNQEIRFPLVQRLVVAMPTGPMDMPIFYGSVFVDAALAGDQAWGSDLFGSVGCGFFVGGGAYPRLRVDLAWPTDFHSIADHADTEFSVGFGY